MNKPPENEIFTFGSNEAGIHGAGAALYAKRNYGAIYGEIRRTGNAYGIPTKKTPYESLPISTIAEYINEFIEYARANPDLTFIVTRIGCGLAGFKDEEIGPWFMTVSDNVILPIEWKEYVVFDHEFHERSSDPKHQKKETKLVPTTNELF